MNQKSGIKMKMSGILGLIIARAGSKGMRNKNMRELGGKPLLAYTLEAAAAAKTLDRIIISTDSLEMADLAKNTGVEAPFMRPPELATDEARSQDVILHALDFLRDSCNYAPCAIMILQPTSPFRTPADIAACVRLFVERQPDGVISITETDSHPYAAKTLGADGSVVPFFPEADMTANRQTWPQAYGLNGAVFLRRSEIYRNWDENAKLGINPEGKRVLGYVMPRERSVEIDDELDFELAELLMARERIR